MSHNPIICAIDTTDLSQAKSIAARLVSSVGAIKLGLEFFTANGPRGVAYIATQKVPIFLDLKFHDIPNTVAGAIRATAGIDTFLMTVHTTGGLAMMKAASEAASEVATATGKQRPLVVGVTVLTSLDKEDLEDMGVERSVSDQVVRLAELAKTSGLDGVVCSPHEIERIRSACGEDFTLVVPGIRPVGSSRADQKRVMTPSEAMEKGADYIVIGRPITEADDPKVAAQEILKSLK